MRYLSKNEKGFTLVEVIVSVLILAVVSAIVLQLFITAGNVSDNAHAMDQAVIKGSSVVEILESYDSPYEAMDLEVFIGAKEVVVNKTPNADEVMIESVMYLNQYFESDTKEAATYVVEVAVKALEAGKIISLDLESSDKELVSLLCEIKVQVVYIESNEVLCTHLVEHYYEFMR